MKIVIDLPKEIISDTKELFYIKDKDHEVVERAIINGKLLPEGHGNLKDVDSIFNEAFPEADIDAEYIDNIKKYPLWRTDISGFQSILKNAPTIIEADKTKSEKEQNLDWMYGIFDHDKIKAYTEQWTKEAEEAGMTLTEYIEQLPSVTPNDDMEAMLEHLWNDTADEESEVDE